ncbi:hypothetical protein SNE40_021813 [Patella caerulea]|uniref:Uncharacterized protein n=1 Tax=Patella caerulea TaxID=87958 RepID=A0AAN8IZE5_PATCE
MKQCGNRPEVSTREEMVLSRRGELTTNGNESATISPQTTVAQLTSVLGTPTSSSITTTIPAATGKRIPKERKLVEKLPPDFILPYIKEIFQVTS